MTEPDMEFRLKTTKINHRGLQLRRKAIYQAELCPNCRNLTLERGVDNQRLRAPHNVNQKKKGK
jgi:hypothetical protein